MNARDKRARDDKVEFSKLAHTLSDQIDVLTADKKHYSDKADQLAAALEVLGVRMCINVLLVHMLVCMHRLCVRIDQIDVLTADKNSL